MPMNGPDRGFAVFQVIEQANPKVADMSHLERDTLLTRLQTIFGGDLAYIVGQATVVPSALKNPPGQAISSPAGPGTVTSAGPITGTGSIT